MESLYVRTLELEVESDEFPVDDVVEYEADGVAIALFNLSHFEVIRQDDAKLDDIVDKGVKSLLAVLASEFDLLVTLLLE